MFVYIYEYVCITVYIYVYTDIGVYIYFFFFKESWTSKLFRSQRPSRSRPLQMGPALGSPEFRCQAENQRVQVLKDRVSTQIPKGYLY